MSKNVFNPSKELALKIAFVVINANRHEGTSRAVLEVAERFAEDHKVDLYARTADVDAKTKLNWHFVGGPSRPEVADFSTFYYKVNRQLRRTNYDIIHSAGPNTSCADIYTIQTVHPVKMQLMKTPRLRQKTSSIRRLSWALYDRFVVHCERQAYVGSGPRGPRAFLPVSEGTRMELTALYQKTCLGDLPNIEVVPNGADIELFHPRNRVDHRNRVRRKFNISEFDFVLLFTGGDWGRKGLDLALRALSLVQEPRIKLLVAGEDRNGVDISQLAQSLNIAERVRFAGFQSNIHEFYAAADLFLFPTMYEAFSLATIEAASSGLPVLMPDVSGARELLGSGETGTVIQRDPQHIANTVMHYFHNPSLVRSSGEAARSLVEREFSWDSIAAKTLSIYQRLLGWRKTLT